MLRDWTKSFKIETLSYQAEVCFTRLIMKVDDYGCYYADERILKSDLFPLRSHSVREADVSRWIAECEKAGLIVLYSQGQKRYLQIVDFKQRLDRAKAKYPLPPNAVNDFPASVNDFPPEEKRSRTELENEVEVPPEEKNGHHRKVPDLKKQVDWKNQFCMSKSLSIRQIDDLIDEFTNRIVLTEDFKPLSELKKHFLNWFEKRPETRPVKKSELPNNTW
jgi:hypothetical protein